MKLELALMAVLLSCARSAVSQTWPSISPGQTSYTVQPSDANLTINALYLPDSFTINAKPNVRSINWVVNEIKIGVNTTINLSAPQNEPPQAPNGAPRTNRVLYPGAAGASEGTALWGFQASISQLLM
jgi:hypothetical protein